MFSAGRECFRRSLKNSRGESLVETLVAILVGALAMTLLASRTGGTIAGAEAIEKSYPDFFEVLRNLGLEVNREAE